MAVPPSPAALLLLLLCVVAGNLPDATGTQRNKDWRLAEKSDGESWSSLDARAAASVEAGFTCAPGSSYSGNFLGAPYQVQIPSNWNNVLVVYAHGYSLTQPQLSGTNGLFSLAGNETAAALLAQGYGLIASAYRARYNDTYRTGGWAVEQALQDLASLTSTVNLYGCNAIYTILYGESMGSVITFASAERYPNVYDGAIAACAAGAGTTALFDSSIIVNMAYDAAFMNVTTGEGGWPTAWGDPHEVASDINYSTQVAPVIYNQLLDSSNAAQWLFVQLVGQVPATSSTEFAEFYLDEIFFSTEGVAELQRRCGTTNVTKSTGRHFSLSDAQIELLASYGFNATRALAYMNAHTNYQSDPSARTYLRRFADYTGRVRIPIMTLHTIVDELITTSSETVYKNLLESTGKSQLLFQAYFNESGHCSFNQQDIVQAVDAMHVWLSQGVKPSNSSFSGNSQFLPGYDPGPYIYA